jgi:hypothetical protein
MTLGSQHVADRAPSGMKKTHRAAPSPASPPDRSPGVGTLSGSAGETLSKPWAACAIWDEKVREIPVAGLVPDHSP